MDPNFFCSALLLPQDLGLQLFAFFLAFNSFLFFVIIDLCISTSLYSWIPCCIMLYSWLQSHPNSINFCRPLFHLVVLFFVLELCLTDLREECNGDEWREKKEKLEENLRVNTCWNIFQTFFPLIFFFLLEMLCKKNVIVKNNAMIK